jgi:hypothetical protein
MSLVTSPPQAPLKPASRTSPQNKPNPNPQPTNNKWGIKKEMHAF